MSGTTMLGFCPAEICVKYNLMQPAGHFVTDMLLKLFWKLSDDPLAEHVGHSQCLDVDLFIGGNGCGVVTIQV